MADIKHLRLILPDALTRLRELQQREALAEVPVTVRNLLQQGAIGRLWPADDLEHARLDPWQHSLLAALPQPLRASGLASAALCWRGEGGQLNGGTWLTVEPVHLEAGLNDLRLTFPPPLNQTESQQLCASLQPLFSLAGFELHTSPSGGWYLWCARALNATTYSPRSGFATRLYDVMPQGEHGAELRRLMTEAQMLLHQHAVNAHRERQGVIGANSLWLWGAGPLQATTYKTPQRVLSDRPYVHGLSEHLQLSCWPLPPDAHALLTLNEADVVAVIPCDSLSALEERWLRPLMTALHNGRIARLDVHLDHWLAVLRGGRWSQLRRTLFNKALSLTEILA